MTATSTKRRKPRRVAPTFNVETVAASLARQIVADLMTSYRDYSRSGDAVGVRVLVVDDMDAPIKRIEPGRLRAAIETTIQKRLMEKP